MRTPRGPVLWCAIWRCVILLALPVWITGCLQIETHVRLHEDGSATITERIRLSKRLLEFQCKPGSPRDVKVVLTREHCAGRAKQMGKGLRLVSHQVRDSERGSRESVAVFKIPRLVDFRYASPFLGTPDYAKHPVITCREWAMYRNVWSGQRAGHMAIGFQCGSRAGRKIEYKPASPAALQIYRHLQPVFADMMKDVRLKFVVEGYAPMVVRRAGQRGRKARTKKVHLIDFSHDDLDAYGSKFLANEEVMVELLQLHINGRNTVRNVAGFSGNMTVPLFRFGNARPEIMFKPSKHYFDKYFVGKTLDFGRHGQRRADPAKDIYREEPNRKKTP